MRQERGLEEKLKEVLTLQVSLLFFAPSPSPARELKAPEVNKSSEQVLQLTCAAHAEPCSRL